VPGTRGMTGSQGREDGLSQSQGRGDGRSRRWVGQAAGLPRRNTDDGRAGLAGPGRAAGLAGRAGGGAPATGGLAGYATTTAAMGQAAAV
jgi:hypothetical protein